jgi:hypothetical protein
MRSRLVYFLLVGVLGLSFLVAGFVNREYAVAVMGGVLILALAYGLSQKQVMMGPANDQKQQRLSFGLAGIIGASLAVNGFASPRYWLAAAGVVILIGSFLQFYRATNDGR